MAAQQQMDQEGQEEEKVEGEYDENGNLIEHNPEEEGEGNQEEHHYEEGEEHQNVEGEGNEEEEVEYVAPEPAPPILPSDPEEKAEFLSNLKKYNRKF